MKDFFVKAITILHPRRITAQMHEVLKDESIGGRLIIAAAALSMVLINSPIGGWFDEFWKTTLSLGFNDWTLSMDLRHWVNEGLMAIFFLVVGLEIKRELTAGELRDKKTALLPVGAAVGGMIFPALIYFVFNPSGEAVAGWGIPIATDIAFAVAVLALLGNRVPTSLKVFLLTLAIVDDIGAITVIALFYAEIINYWFLSASILLLITMVTLRHHLVDRLWVIVLLGVILWVTTHLSGIHASVVGVALGLIAPFTTRKPNVRPVAFRAEYAMLPFSTFFVLPIFALANAGFVLSSGSLFSYPSVLLGVIGGLVIGKSLGIVFACWLMTRFNIAALPTGLTLKHIFGAGLIAGIGFTVSIFITKLAFDDNEALIASAKFAILIASVVSATLGLLVIRAITKKMSMQ